ncbi:YaiI/YqxD family protein [Gottfriedia sp. NPDC056225]|uniref:YaiI/YqxD family protein n=1 Tax=Gottfriedia sp. NPDC056225 TaxID=3345751 RepID=UPI0015585D72|nr:YaiI/YqxD family protein [Arthrobacter citreus]
MKILIDADGCPVVSETIKIAAEFNVNVLLLCDTAHIMQREGAETIVISQGADAVDFALVNRVSKGDVIITQDYGLAAMVLSKQAYVLNQNGFQYTNENIDSLLHTRYVSKKIRNAGGRVKGPKKRQKEDNANFENGLRSLLTSITL